MRENIGLYRGKRKDNGEWLYGSLMKVTLVGISVYIIFEDSFTVKGNEVEALSHAQVDPETVGELTDIPDKTGIIVAEGDVLKIVYLFQKPVTAVVEFTDGKFTARYTCSGKEHIDNLSWTASSLYEIIGNIHDNPELLEAADG